MENLLSKTNEASTYISNRIDFKPEIGLILGSGLGSLADEIEDAIIIDYEEIPNFPISTVEGHDGKLVIGTLEGKKVIAMKGRFHYYEGYTMQEITFPVRVMKALGINILLVTNACGGLNKDLYPGALMIIEDHINFMGDNPLIGPNYDELGPRFPDMSNAYSKCLIKVAEKVSKKVDIDAKKGVYTAVSGPYYFSRAELSMLRKIGGDAIGMSTVPEVIVARHSDIKVLGIACVTDMAIPEELVSITHDEVVEVANKTKPKFIQLVKGIINDISLN
ncbi:purine-nucleoside phosphorylase [Caldisalinibacter kiritimatiensis]|uniref:Purine nucleoside phosphorylase n=1 Tax=Caldisalinibacter kiritimatiensis TaxID=1304284 RepID=R1CFJ9_9FIRM|nr:purine-nucleoside phosphorylase [Caldisalinibacter kiritimatiensis]EOD01075.1 Purine nucleoside phosphorylase [Caldisalinibacter kiritimatiensis]